MKLLNFTSFILCLFLLSGCSTNWRGFYARRIANGSYERVAHGAKLKAQDTKNKTLASQYCLYAGLAYQLGGKANEAIQCFNKSIELEKKYNYFAYLQKAKIFNSQNYLKNEMINLNLSLEAIDKLISKVNEGLTFREKHIFPTIEFYVGYYVFKESIERQNQDFIKRLRVRKKEIQKLIPKQKNIQK